MRIAYQVASNYLMGLAGLGYDYVFGERQFLDNIVWRYPIAKFSCIPELLKNIYIDISDSGTPSSDLEKIFFDFLWVCNLI